MSKWHACETTHCRAGWVVTLAGPEGKALEKETSTCFAAMQIYKASSDIKVSPTRFFESSEIAMADIKRCAKEEAEAAIKYAMRTAERVFDEVIGEWLEQLKHGN